MKSASEIRKAFIGYFREHGHAEIRSSSLVPVDDPSLLFTNAGMVQFKEVFLGKERRPYARAVTSQKCVRAGGKHNDLESVGKTLRHHTFFEMLGNFSFGDYFKREAIGYAWEFLTKVMALPKDQLWATVYVDDDEAAGLWRTVSGLPAERIVRLGEKDNFWSMGDSGPCGPCSEVVIDRGKEFACSTKCALGKCDCDRWLELWNLVFMQYDKDVEGRMMPLPRPSIDTGMGLERIASVIQGVNSNFDTDLMSPIIGAVESLSKKKYSPGPEGMAFRVIADHVRACVFLVGDGVIPSNEGRGYVLRRILRRAVRFGRVLNIQGPFLAELVPVVCALMADAYPELQTQQQQTSYLITHEERRFLETLEDGSKVAEDLISKAKSQGLGVLPGEWAFVLYDTYGFPLDITEDVAEERGLRVDRQGFDEAMEQQRRRARAAQEEARAALFRTADGRDPFEGLPATKFNGYDRLESAGKILALFKTDQGARRIQAAAPGTEVVLVTDETPFYAEAGGQVSDRGRIRTKEAEIEVDLVTRTGPKDALFLHQGKVLSGTVQEGDGASLIVDSQRRMAAARHHTATHLLHKALKEVLGHHVNQSGSLVAPERLRFDFSHFSAVKDRDIEKIEDIVNSKILEDLPVDAEEKGIEEARQEGAVALFGERYGDRVRVVSIDDFSKELCGGTHVTHTGEIGLFKVVLESGIGSGLRRIEAVAGWESLRLLREKTRAAELAAGYLKCSSDEMPDKVGALAERLRRMEEEIERAQARRARDEAIALLGSAVDLDGVKVVTGQVEASSMESLRQAGDVLRNKIGCGVVVIGAVIDGRAALVAMATPEAIRRGVHAGRVVKDAARVVGGGGGGRAEIAQAGGNDKEKLSEAFCTALETVKRLISVA